MATTPEKDFQDDLNPHSPDSAVICCNSVAIQID